MNDYLMVFRSLTYAQRAGSLLSGRGFRVAVVRTPADIWKEGCGWSVRLRGADIKAAIELLRPVNLMPKRAFRLENGEIAGEVAL